MPERTPEQISDIKGHLIACAWCTAGNFCDEGRALGVDAWIPADYPPHLREEVLRERAVSRVADPTDEEWKRANQSVEHLHTPLNGLLSSRVADPTPAPMSDTSTSSALTLRERLGGLLKKVLQYEREYAYAEAAGAHPDSLANHATRMVAKRAALDAELDAVCRDADDTRERLAGVVEGNARAAVSTRKQIHDLLDAAGVEPHADYLVRLASLAASRSGGQNA
jgi:hypothetical protein